MADANILIFGNALGGGTIAVPDNNTTALEIDSIDDKNYLAIDTTDSAEKLILAGGGAKVGIGEADPDTVLHVHDDAGAHITISGNATTDDVGISLESLSGVRYGLLTSNGNTGVLKLRSGSTETGGGYSVQLASGGSSTEHIGLILSSTGKLSSGGETTSLGADAGSLHLKTGDSAATSSDVHADADDLIVEGSGNTGISILTPTNGKGCLYFIDENTGGTPDGIAFDQGTGSLRLQVANSERLRIQNDSVIRIFDGGKLSTGSESSPICASNGIHIKEDDTGIGSANTHADMLVIEANTHPGISLLSNNTSRNTIAFGDPQSSMAGELRYTHGGGSNADMFFLLMQNSVAINVDHDHKLGVNHECVDSSAQLTVAGNLTADLNGTFTATNGSATLASGSSTAFDTQLEAGSAIEIFESGTSRGVFTVASITSATELVLDSTVSGLSSSPKTGMTGKTDADLLDIQTGDSQTALTIKGGGLVGIGATAPVHLLQVQDGDLGIVTNSADANGQSLVFTKSRNATDGSHTVVNDNDVLGEIEFKGSDGDSFEVGAKIIARVDGTPSDGDVPTEIVFASGDGSEYMSVGQANSLYWTDGESSGNTGTQTVGLVTEKNNTDIPNNKSVLIGARAGKASNNHSLTIIGSEAAEYGAGQEATIVGYFAGNAGPSNNVTLIGSRAGSAMNSTGNQNVCVGSYSGDSITSGDLNVCVGSFSDAAATTSNQIAIGYQATATVTNEAVIGNAQLAAIRPMSAGQCLIGGAGFEVSGMVGFGGGVLMGRAAPVSSINQDQKILAQVFASSASVLTIPANSYVVRMGITSTSNADSNAYSVTLNTGTVSGETALGALTNSVERIGAGAANSRTSASTGSAADLAVAATGSHTKVVGITTEGFFAGTDDLYLYVMTAGTGNANTGSGLNFTFGVFVEYIGMD